MDLCTATGSTGLPGVFRQRFYKVACGCAAGADVYGLERENNWSFRQACHRFICRKLVAATDRLRHGGCAKPKSLQPPSAAIPILKKAISQIVREAGWLLLGEVGGQVSNLFSDFDVRSYGHNKLSDLVRKTGAFDVEKSNSGQLRMRVKPAEGSAKIKPP